MMQPSFIPWLGYFELIHKADKFIFLDDFQFSVQSYHQRNRLFVNRDQVGWYSVPVLKSVSFKSNLNQTIIDESSGWRVKMWKRIQNNYSKARFYKELSSQIEQILLTQAPSLAEQNISFIRLVCEILGYKKEFIFSSHLGSEGERSERVVSLLRSCGATSYYSARGAFDYMREDGVFPLKNINVFFQNFEPQTYPQVGSKDSFIPFLSIIDALMNVGPEETSKLIQAGTKEWLTWDTMLTRSDIPVLKEDNI